MDGVYADNLGIRRSNHGANNPVHDTGLIRI